MVSCVPSATKKESNDKKTNCRAGPALPAPDNRFVHVIHAQDFSNR
jgi:hypothetical protein